MKKCCKCRELKPASEFYRNVTRKDGLQSFCKTCNKDIQHSHGIARRYGLTTVDWDAMFDQQKGVCAICEKPKDKQQHRLCVDHDHATGKVRGLLCKTCNRLLGRLEAIPGSLERISVYLFKSPVEADCSKGDLAPLDPMSDCLPEGSSP